MASRRLTLPNVITLCRIAACPVLFWLVLRPGVAAGFWAFALFIVAALSDLWDGYLARKYGWITDVGKLLDPLADKLLLVATLVPIYLVSNLPGELNDVPWWGPLPLWVLVVIFVRELAITVFRAYAARRGVVVAAGRSGKLKSLAQSLFVGGLLLWYPLLDTAVARSWDSAQAWELWSVFHGGWVGIMLSVALVLTIYSMFDYLWSYRTLMGVRD